MEGSSKVFGVTSMAREEDAEGTSDSATVVTGNVMLYAVWCQGLQGHAQEWG